MDSGVICTYGGPILTDLVFHRRWLSEDHVLLRRHVPSWREGNISGIVIPVDSTDEVSVLLTEIAESEGEVQLTSTVSEIAKALERGSIGVIMGATFKAIGANIEALILYRQLGARVFALSLNPRNLLTDGCGERDAGGLSYLGIKAVQEIERLGVLIDVSHTSDRGFWEVIEATRHPILASHSNARRVCDNPRNLGDDQIKAIAERGGIVALSTYPTLVSEKPQPTIDDYLEHMDYLRGLVGIDYIAVGADFIDYVYDFVNPGVRSSDPTGTIYGEAKQAVTHLERISQVKNIAPGLQARGYSESEIEAVSSGNFLRLLESLEDPFTSNQIAADRRGD